MNEVTISTTNREIFPEHQVSFKIGTQEFYLHPEPTKEAASSIAANLKIAFEKLNLIVKEE